MTQLVAKIEKEWGEIGFGSSKRDGWAWEVSYFVDGEQIDKHVYSLETVAVENAARFERGDWNYGEYNSVSFNEGK